MRRSATPAKDTRDGRTTIGGIRISIGRFDEEPAPAQTNGTDASPIAAAGASPARTDGTIVVPLNTLGPGESLQQRNERIAADREYAGAQARIASRLADQPLETDALGDPLRSTPIFLHGFVHRTGWDAYHRRGYVGPVAGFDDLLHGRAIREFSEAATAGTGVLGNLHQDAIRTFGVAATPPVIQIENDRAEAQRNISKGRPARPKP